MQVGTIWTGGSAMVTLETLIEMAKFREMPPTKMRGILREYLQTLILRRLYRTKYGRLFWFTGGSYLRILHNLKRFSEDLDFNVRRVTRPRFEYCVGQLAAELRRVGVITEVQYAHWGDHLVAKLVFPEVERFYNIISSYSRRRGIVIKLQASRRRWKVKTETDVISGFGETYPCLCTNRGVLFADKIDAYIEKGLGRHLYDIIFMVSNRFPFDSDALTALGIKEDPLGVVLAHVLSASEEQLRKQADVLRPFLFDESDAELLVNAHTLLPPLISRYREYARRD